MGVREMHALVKYLFLNDLQSKVLLVKELTEIRRLRSELQQKKGAGVSRTPFLLCFYYINSTYPPRQLFELYFASQGSELREKP
jgi:hypothetical protein